MEVEMKIRGLMMDPNTNSPIVILKDVDGDTMLPIWVGHFEAHAIALEIEKIAPQRPMTHDLLRNVINQFGATVNRVVVTDLIDNTFYAVIELKLDGRTILIDSRPSDAIALALRTDSPIYVNREVIESSQSAIIERAEEEDSEIEGKDADTIEWPDELDDDISKYKM